MICIDIVDKEGINFYIYKIVEYINYMLQDWFILGYRVLLFVYILKIFNFDIYIEYCFIISCYIQFKFFSEKVGILMMLNEYIYCCFDN